MSLEKCLFVLMFFTLSMAMPRNNENPGNCSPFTVKLMSSLGAEPKALKCGQAASQQVRGLMDIFPGEESRFKRGSCCGPECDYFIQTMNIDPLSVICVMEE